MRRLSWTGLYLSVLCFVASSGCTGEISVIPARNRRGMAGDKRDDVTLGFNAGRQAPEPCNGYDDDLDGEVDEGCPCVPGTTQACYLGTPTKPPGSCAPGQQRCGGSGEFGEWEACVGAVAPAAEICGDGIDQDCDGADKPCERHCTPEACQDGLDNDCDGMADCADPDCLSATACIVEKCRGGHIKVADLWYCSSDCTGGGIGIASAESFDHAAAGVCGQNLGAGGSLTSNCAGTFEVCAVVKADATKKVFAETCVTVNVLADGATVPLPKFPGFQECGARAQQALSDGFYTCLRVRGTTVQGVAVDKEVHCGWYAVAASGSSGDKGAETGGGSW